MYIPFFSFSFLQIFTWIFLVWNFCCSFKCKPCFTNTFSSLRSLCFPYLKIFFLPSQVLVRKNTHQQHIGAEIDSRFKPADRECLFDIDAAPVAELQWRRIMWIINGCLCSHTEAEKSSLVCTSHWEQNGHTSGNVCCLELKSSEGLSNESTAALSFSILST